MNPITVPASLDSLAVIRKCVADAAGAAGLDKATGYGLQLAVDEIATNIIVHGYQEAGLSGNLHLLVEITGKILTIIIEDTGPAYDPRTHSMPDAEDLLKPLEEREIGGLGIYLAFQGVDQFDYERVEDRNRNIFIVNRPATD